MNAQNTVAFDASAALAFALKDEEWHAQAVALVADLLSRNVGICAPPLFENECDSVIRRNIHHGTLGAADAEEARRIIAALGTRIIHEAATRERAYQIATFYNQPRAYDATYAALAEAHGLELWTADKRFFNAVNGTTVTKRLSFVRFIGGAT